MTPTYTFETVADLALDVSREAAIDDARDQLLAMLENEGNDPNLALTAATEADVVDMSTRPLGDLIEYTVRFSYTTDAFIQGARPTEPYVSLWERQSTRHNWQIIATRPADMLDQLVAYGKAFAAQYGRLVGINQWLRPCGGGEPECTRKSNDTTIQAIA